MISKQLFSWVQRLLYSHRLRLCAVGLILSLGIVWTVRPTDSWASKRDLEVRNLFTSLAKQTLEKINSETGANANLRKATASSISSTLFRAFYSDDSLLNTVPEAYLIGVKQAQGAELARFKAMDLMQCYAENKGSANKFLSGLRSMGVDRGIILDWNDPKVVKAVSKVYGCLVRLDEQDITISASSHYRSREWSGEIRFSWYPSDSMARLYAVITFSGSNNVKTAILSSSGRITTQKHKPFARTISISDYSLNLSTRTLNASGSYCLPNVTNMAGGGSLFVDNNCRLKIQNFEVSGRVLETIAESGREGTFWNIEYVLTGTADKFGNMSGTCVIKGKQAAFEARFGSGVNTEGATWKASRRGNQLKGVINVGGTHTVSWQANLSD
ncbi:MAG: hypothetical protein ACI38Q_07740 [Candidatus Bruticola sp.]